MDTEKNIITFIILLIISYLIVGYVSNEVFARIDWIKEVTIGQKLTEYYIRSLPGNFFPSVILAGLLTSLAIKIRKGLNKS